MRGHKFQITLCVLWRLNRSTTRESKKNQREWCQDEDHKPFRVHILQLRVLEKVSSVFTGGGWSWIDSKATGVERAGGRANHPDLAATPAVWAPLTISGHLFFHFAVRLSSQLLYGCCLIFIQMHVRAHTKEAICCKMNQWSNNSGFNSSYCGHSCLIFLQYHSY